MIRLVRERGFSRGRLDLSVEARDESVLERLVTKLNEAGWKREWSTCWQDCDYGFSTDYGIPHDQFEQFNTAYKKAKAELLAELRAELPADDQSGVGYGCTQGRV